MNGHWVILNNPSVLWLNRFLHDKIGYNVEKAVYGGV
jgi:hypothetical protein